MGSEEGTGTRSTVPGLQKASGVGKGKRQVSTGVGAPTSPQLFPYSWPPCCPCKGPKEVRSKISCVACRLQSAHLLPAPAACCCLLSLSLALALSVSLSRALSLSSSLPSLSLQAGGRMEAAGADEPVLYALTLNKQSQGRERARDTPARSVSAGTPTTKPKSSGSSATHSPWACAPRRAFSRAQVAAAGPGCSPGCCSSLALELQAPCSWSS
jgi:hypothetical protein